MARRVLIVVNSVWNVLNFRMGLVRALRAQGYDVIVAAAPDHDTAALEKEGCRFVPIAIDSRGASVRRDFGLFLRYRRLLAAERPDIILGYTIKPNIYCSAAARLFGIPMVNNISGLGTAFIHDDHAVGHGHGFDLVVGHVEGRHTELGLKLPDLQAHLHAKLGIEVRKRFVE